MIGGLIGRPFLALVAILVAVFVFWASSYIGPHMGVASLMYIWPNEYLTLIAGGEAGNTAKGLALALSFVVSALGASVTLFTKRDV